MIDRSAVTAGLLVALRSSGFSVGDGAPPKPLPADEVPYGILEEAPGGGRWGPLLTGPDSASWVYQVRSVGRTREHAGRLRDALDRIVVGTTAGGAFTTAIAVAGAVVGMRELDSDGGVDREEDVYNATVRYVLHVVPA